MRAILNDGLRWLIGWIATLVGALLCARRNLALRGYRRGHARLAVEHAITGAVPIEAYGPATRARIDALASRLGDSEARFALTSGSSSEPKRLLYTQARLRQVKGAFMDMFCRLFWAAPLRRRSLFVLSALAEDESLTSRLLAEPRVPGLLGRLQAPYRVQGHPAVAALFEAHGVTAVRFLLLVTANPGLLYATNPSTLSTFFDEVNGSWSSVTQLVRAVHADPRVLPPAARRLLRSISSRGARARLARIAGSDVPLPVESCLPGLEAYVCWTGGYVAPFLARLELHLPPARYRRIAMYAMSTETIETTAHFPRRGSFDVAFHPMLSALPAMPFWPRSPGTLYELLPEAAPDLSDNLIPPWEATPGQNYLLVVSDAFGLRRYQTDDLFHCERIVRGLPDLRFVRRRALEHSFTGEKLTAEQLMLVFEGLRESHPDLRHAPFLACIPSQPPDEKVPHYRFVIVAPHDTAAFDITALGAEAERRLRAVNPEYRTKVESGRLRPLRAMRTDTETLARLVGGSRHRNTWEAQFKFLPLYRRTLEDMLASGQGA